MTPEPQAAPTPWRVEYEPDTGTIGVRRGEPPKRMRPITVDNSDDYIELYFAYEGDEEFNLSMERANRVCDAMNSADDRDILKAATRVWAGLDKQVALARAAKNLSEHAKAFSLRSRAEQRLRELAGGGE